MRRARCGQEEEISEQLSTQLLSSDAGQFHSSLEQRQTPHSYRLETFEILLSCSAMIWTAQTLAILVDSLHEDRFWRRVHCAGNFFVALVALALKHLLTSRVKRSEFVRRHLNAIASAMFWTMMNQNQMNRAIAEARRCWGKDGCIFDTTSFPPRRLCKDSDPWRSAQMPVVGQAQEDHGCEGRYNSAVSISAACIFISIVPVSGIPLRHATVLLACQVFSYCWWAVCADSHRDGSLLRALLLVCSLCILAIASILGHEKQAVERVEAVKRMRLLKERHASLVRTLIPPKVFEQALASLPRIPFSCHPRSSIRCPESSPLSRSPPTRTPCFRRPSGKKKANTQTCRRRPSRTPAFTATLQQAVTCTVWSKEQVRGGAVRRTVALMLRTDATCDGRERQRRGWGRGKGRHGKTGWQVEGRVLAV